MESDPDYTTGATGDGWGGVSYSVGDILRRSAVAPKSPFVPKEVSHYVRGKIMLALLSQVLGGCLHTPTLRTPFGERRYGIQISEGVYAGLKYGSDYLNQVQCLKDTCLLRHGGISLFFHYVEDSITRLLVRGADLDRLGSLESLER